MYSGLAGKNRELLVSLLPRLVSPKRAIDLERLGTDYGGWYVPVASVRSDWVVYSAGVGEDISFDLELIRRTGCRVEAFDPTPRARAFVENQRELSDAFRFHPYGLWNRCGSVRFFAPQNPKHVSHSITNLQRTRSYFEGEVRTIPAVMRELGHTRIDLLKMDIEGAEYEVIRTMLASKVRPSFVCVELESPWLIPNLALLFRLYRNGYAVLHVEGRNVTFGLRELLAVSPSARSER